MKLKKRQTTYGGHFDLDGKEKEVLLLEKKMQESSFWDDKKTSEEIISKLKSLKAIIDQAKDLINKINTSIELADILDEESDDELKKQIEDSMPELYSAYDELEIFLLLSDEYDKCNCVLEIHPGAGGTESCDWALMLYRMYTRWCEKHGYPIEVLDYQEGEEAGIKSVSILIKGENAYGYLKNEKGIHRLIRLSPFDSNNRRHTSFASVEVTPEIVENDDIEIQEKDLKIDVYRSSGAGGQHVNTTDSAVRITHLPTKTVATCQTGRSQIQNKEKALQILKNKLKLMKLEKENEKKQELKKEQKNIDFGSQIRSYVMHPYSLVKDHRTLVETSNVSKVLNGEIDEFINANLRRK